MVEKKLLYRGSLLDTRQPHWYHTIREQPVKSFLQEFLSDDPYFTVHTSGSTGTPKAIVLEKGHMRASALMTLEFLKLKPAVPCLLCLPADKIAGMMMLVRWLEAGLDLYPVEPTSSPLQEVGGSFGFAAMVPLQVRQSMEELHRVEKLIIGGGPVDAELEKHLRKMPGQIFHTYGMTETISHVAMRKLSGRDANEHFRALPGVSFSQDQRGCLVIDGPHIGVHRMPTNDVVHLLDPFSFSWIGRADNVVNSGGIKLHPELLEQKLGKADFDYFLTGMPDERLGQKLVVVVNRQSEADLQEVRQFIEALQGYERPRAILQAQFFYTANGKIQREKTIREGKAVELT